MPSWVPNALTTLRIALLPLWWMQASACTEAVYYGDDGTSHRWWALVILTVIGLSDVLDGFVARRFGLASKLGAVLDAAADKLAQVVMLVYFTFYHGLAFEPVPLEFFALVILRDVIMAGGILAVRTRRGTVQVHHAWHGKVSSLLLFALLVGITAELERAWTDPLRWAVAALIGLSTLSYACDGWRQWRSGPDPDAQDY